jgi:hypothetical protein
VKVLVTTPTATSAFPWATAESRRMSPADRPVEKPVARVLTPTWRGDVEATKRLRQSERIDVPDLAQYPPDTFSSEGSLSARCSPRCEATFVEPFSRQNFVSRSIFVEALS